MDTQQLIRTLGADAPSVAPPPGRLWRVAIAASIVTAFIAFMVLCGPRTDFAEAAQTGRFLFKFVVTLSLAVTAYFAARAAVQPGAPLAHKLGLMALPLVLLLVAVATELALLPSDQWMVRLIGTNSLWCLGLIPAIGLVPLVILLGVMRSGAPTHPVLAGAIAGLLAGGIAATFYAAHCFDDSPLFVATWYTLAVVVLTTVGAGAGRVLLRW
jgi:hypothetical protein